MFEHFLRRTSNTCADYRKVWPFPTESLATSTTTSKKLCFISKFVLSWKKGHWRDIDNRRERSWQKLLMALHSTPTSAVSVFREKRKRCSVTSVHHLRAALLAHVEATCQSGTPPKRCSASSRQRAPKSNFRFYSKLNTMKMLVLSLNVCPPSELEPQPQSNNSGHIFDLNCCSNMREAYN